MPAWREMFRRLNLESIGRCVQNMRLCWFGHIERMDKSFWGSRCRAVEVSGSVGRGRPKKTWEEVIRIDLRERRVSKDLARDSLEVNFQKPIQRMPTCKTDVKPNMMMTMISTPFTL